MIEIEATKEEIAYIAGLFEGEACFTIRKESRGARIVIGMTDFDVIERARKIVGRGNIRTSNNGFKTNYILRLYGEHALEWMKLIYPYLGERRRKKIDEIIEAYERPSKERMEVIRKHSEKIRNPEFKIAQIIAKARGISLEEAKIVMKKTEEKSGIQ